MYAPSFLHKSRHGIWYFRYVFSRPWRQRLGKTELRRSLATRDRHEAIRQARLLAVALETRLLSPYDSNMQYKDIRALVEQYIEAGKAAVVIHENAAKGLLEQAVGTLVRLVECLGVRTEQDGKGVARCQGPAVLWWAGLAILDSHQKMEVIWRQAVAKGLSNRLNVLGV